MFTTLSLFRVRCPYLGSCERKQCLYSHSEDTPPEPALHIPIEAAPQPVASTPANPVSRSAVIPAKRPDPPPRRLSSPIKAGEPPRKLQKLGPTQRPAAVPTSSVASASGVPLLRVIAAQSLVPIPVRQTMLKTLYEHFRALYSSILDSNPGLASEHALRQEAEVYATSTKHTYRNAIIQSIAGLKRRVAPNTVSHPSVGTEGELAARLASQKVIDSLHLTRETLQPYLLSPADLAKWGFMTEIPPGPGGTQPSKEGEVTTCERCSKTYVVTRDPPAECSFHIAKAFSQNVSGERLRIYACCGRPASDPGGCATGPHVFYETKIEDLHNRHAFSELRPQSDSPNTVLDVVAMDCEMVYTTGGMRVARVSVVDGAGKEVFDQLVRMDEGVEIVDYITQFSGITKAAHDQSVLSLSQIRRSLDSLLSQETVIVGHALDNDLRTLRIVHTKVVDTSVLFPHRAGAPYRRALRDLTKEHLNRSIQQGGAAGHSSVEDSIATLDLVKAFVVQQQQRAKTGSSSKSKSVS